jgi:integrase
MSVLIELYETRMRAAGLSPRTIKDRVRVLATADRELPYGIDTAADVEISAWLANPTWGPWTRSTYFHHLAGFYHWAAGGIDPQLTFDPMRGMPAPRIPESVPHPATDEQVRLALERSPMHWATAIRLAAYAGLRAGEVQRIRREDVAQDYLTIWHGKGDRTASLPTHPEIWRVVEHRPPGLLVTNRRGGPLGIYSRQSEHFRRIGLPGLHMHMLRHWFATMLLRGGADIETVRQLMRHQSLETTKGYLAISDGQRVAAVAALPTFAAMAYAA